MRFPDKNGAHRIGASAPTYYDEFFAIGAAQRKSTSLRVAKIPSPSDIFRGITIPRLWVWTARQFTRMAMARDALRVPPASSHCPHIAKGHHRVRVRLGSGYTVLPTGLVVAYAPPAQHHHTSSTAVPPMGHYGPYRRSIVVPKMAPGDLANLRSSQICTKASNSHAKVQATTDSTRDPIAGGNLGSSTARGSAIEGGDL
jgi:hypothetical protein